MDGQPAGTRPVGIRQRRTRGAPDDELDLAERGTAARRQPVRRVRQQGDGDRRNLTGGEQGRGDDKISTAKGVLEALAEKGDRAGVVGMAGVGVHGAVQLQTGGEQAQQPDRERTNRSHDAQGAGGGEAGGVGHKSQGEES